MGEFWRRPTLNEHKKLTKAYREIYSETLIVFSVLSLIPVSLFIEGFLKLLKTQELRAGVIEVAVALGFVILMLIAYNLVAHIGFRNVYSGRHLTSVGVIREIKIDDKVRFLESNERYLLICDIPRYRTVAVSVTSQVRNTVSVGQQVRIFKPSESDADADMFSIGNLEE